MLSVISHSNTSTTNPKRMISSQAQMVIEQFCRVSLRGTSTNQPHAVQPTTKLTMKTKPAFNLILLALMLIVFSNVRTASATPQQKSSATKVVKVYFYHDPGEYIDLSPVTRLVSGTSPARAAIDALLKGPTARERQ